MAEVSGMHFYLNWTKQRIDELDATLASLESAASRMDAGSKAKADQFIGDLKKQRDAFQAKAKVWQVAADSVHGEATKVAAARRAEVEAAVEQMKAKAAEAEAQLQKLRQAGDESWAAMSAALADSRKAFDRASQAAWDALKCAQP